MRLKVHPMLKGSTRTTLHHPRRQHMNMDKHKPAEVYDTSVGEGVRSNPVRRATEKLKHLSIRQSKPLRKYISFGWTKNNIIGK